MPADGLLEAYSRIRNCLNGVELGRYLEPLAHVTAIDALRFRYRPSTVRLLVIAESHVRKSDVQVAAEGPGLVFNPNHGTRWWRDLLIPGFGGAASSNVHYRLRCLERLKDSGFWVVDSSIVALSGYKKVNPEWKRRPLDAYREQIVRDSWCYYTRSLLDPILEQKDKPVFVLYRCVRDLLGDQLPGEIASEAFHIDFRGQQNELQYENDDYLYGTHRFREAANAAGLGNCLRNIYSSR